MDLKHLLGSFKSAINLLKPQPLPEEMTYYFINVNSGNPCYGRFKTKDFSKNGRLNYEKISIALGFKIEVHLLKDESLIRRLNEEGNFFI